MSQSTYVQKPMTAEIWVIFMLSLQHMFYVVPMHVNTTFNSSSHKKCTPKKFLVLLKSPNRHSLLIAVTPLSHWSGLNTPKSSGVSTLSDNTWTRLSVNRRQDVEAQSTGLYNPLTLILWILGVVTPKLWCMQTWSSMQRCYGNE
jgi:hypothetical protein